MQYIKTIPTVEGRNAEVALFCHQPDEAESILLQAGLVFRAIDMNRTLHRWERALDLALKHKTHIDTVGNHLPSTVSSLLQVLALRQKYLDRTEKPETLAKFLQYSGSVEIDWEQISAKMAAEEEKERSRPGAKPYV